MFYRLPEIAKTLDRESDIAVVTIDGHEFAARLGDSVAAAMLAAGLDAFRTTPVSGRLRGPYCMMGTCFDCLTMIDGRPNQQACMIQTRAGMVIERQNGARAAIGNDLPSGVPP
jgi:predicted molibdopterin-dependent oxidoreductase YjgC